MAYNLPLSVMVGRGAPYLRDGFLGGMQIDEASGGVLRHLGVGLQVGDLQGLADGLHDAGRTGTPGAEYGRHALPGGPTHALPDAEAVSLVQVDHEGVQLSSREQLRVRVDVTQSVAQGDEVQGVIFRVEQHGCSKPKPKLIEVAIRNGLNLKIT